MRHQRRLSAALFCTALCPLIVSGATSAAFGQKKAAPPFKGGADKPNAPAVAAPAAVPRIALPPEPPAFGPALTFADALRTLSEQTGAAFIAEGAPRVWTPEAQAALENTNAPVTERATKFAAALDYELERGQNGATYLLRKRYSDARDLPCITVEELADSLADMLAVNARLAPFLVPSRTNGSDICGDILRDITRNATDEEARALAKGVPLSEASPTLRKKMEMLTATAYLDSIDVEGADEYRLLSDYDNWRLKKAPFGYGGINTIVLGNIADKGKYANLFNPLTGYAPHAGAVPAPGQTAPSPAVTTLGREVERINQVSASNGAAKATRFAVANLLAAKPVTTAGLERLPPTRAVHALAALYKLRVQADKVAKNNDETLRIVRFRMPKDTTLQTWNSALRDTFPAPLARALTGESAFAPPSPVAPPPRRSFSIPPGGAGQPSNSALAFTLEAIRFLRMREEANLNKPGENGGEPPGVPVVSLPNSERVALALALQPNLLTTLTRKLKNDTPRYITRFGELQVRVVRSISDKGKKIMDLQLLLPDDQSKEYVPCFGMGGEE